MSWAVGGVVLLGISYFGFLLLQRNADPCAGIFEELATSLNATVKRAQDLEVTLNLGQARVGELSEKVQPLAISMKSCCIMAKQGLIAADRCIELSQRVELAAQDLQVKLKLAEKAPSPATAEPARAAVENLREAAQKVDDELKNVSGGHPASPQAAVDPPPQTRRDSGPKSSPARDTTSSQRGLPGNRAAEEAPDVPAQAAPDRAGGGAVPNVSSTTALSSSARRAAMALVNCIKNGQLGYPEADVVAFACSGAYADRLVDETPAPLGHPNYVQIGVGKFARCTTKEPTRHCSVVLSVDMGSLERVQSAAECVLAGDPEPSFLNARAFWVFRCRGDAAVKLIGHASHPNNIGPAGRSTISRCDLDPAECFIAVDVFAGGSFPRRGQLELPSVTAP